MSVEEMCSWALHRPDNATAQCNWGNMTNELMEWAALQLDGDGCVTMQQDHDLVPVEGAADTSLRLTFSKAENAYIALYVMLVLFGGSVVAGSPQKGYQQATRMWSLTGFAAAELVHQLTQFSTIKRPQYVLAATYLKGINVAKKLRPCAAKNARTGEIIRFG